MLRTSTTFQGLRFTGHPLAILLLLLFQYATDRWCEAQQPPTYDHVGAVRAFFARGERYEARVPDTLDLAQRAGYGLNYFFGILNDDLNYEMYFGGTMRHLYPHITSLGACQDKALEAIAFERLMTGSEADLDREGAMVDRMLAMFGPDGLHWVDEDSSKKPWMKIDEPFVMVHGQGRIMRAMIAWYQITGDPIWKRKIDGLVEGIDKIAVHKEDYAYIPIFGFYEEDYFRSCYTKDGWKDTHEPVNEKEGEEGSLFNHQAHLPGALATWYQLTGNKQALKLSGELVRFYTKPQFWADFEDPSNEVVGKEHAHWVGHLHGHVNCLRAILEYAIAADDPRLKDFVRDGYEWTRHVGFARIGYVGDNQGCGCARLIGLAVKLSEAGIGDYWEDVDKYIRNLGTEQQFTPEDLPFMRTVCGQQKAPPEGEEGVTYQGMPDRIVGAYGGRTAKTTHWLCCGTHGNMGLFYAWDATLRFKDGVARVNLLLNRASPWLQIDSYLPYEGKVVLKNRSAHTILLRIPNWADKNQVTCRLGEASLQLEWDGQYVRLENLNGGEQLTVAFPMKEWTAEYNIPLLGGANDDFGVPGEKSLAEVPPRAIHRCHFLGNTLIEIDPPLMPGEPVFQRKHYLSGKAPMKDTDYFVTPTVLKW
jgi:hypothetical protein